MSSAAEDGDDSPEEGSESPPVLEHLDQAEGDQRYRPEPEYLVRIQDVKIVQQEGETDGEDDEPEEDASCDVVGTISAGHFRTPFRPGNPRS